MTGGGEPSLIATAARGRRDLRCARVPLRADRVALRETARVNVVAQVQEEVKGRGRR
jgi:hypothetical protein